MVGGTPGEVVVDEVRRVHFAHGGQNQLSPRMRISRRNPSFSQTVTGLKARPAELEEELPAQYAGREELETAVDS